MASLKQPRKGILKTSSSFDKEADAHRPKETKWDEMNILATHHPPDKDYGHMKIDEPPTPYSKLSDQEEDGEEGSEERRGSVGNKVDISTLSERLEDIEGHRERRVSTGGEDSSEEEEETEEHRAQRLKFEQKRKLHYNEFQAVKLAKQLMEEEDEEDEDDDANSSEKVVDNTNTDTDNMQTDQAEVTSKSETAESQSGSGNVSEKRETLIN